MQQVNYHLKLDEEVARELELEVSLGHAKRNRIINEAVKWYIKALDAKRTSRMMISTVWPHPAIQAYVDDFFFLEKNRRDKQLKDKLY